MQYILSFVLLGWSMNILTHLFRSWKSMTNVPASMPWAGSRNEILPNLRACMREFVAGLRTLSIGYENYSRKGQAFVIPDPGLRPQIMVPKEHLRWMVELPETVLSARLPQVGRFAVNYLAPGIDVDHDLFMMDAVRKDLTRNLGRLQPSIYQDISESIDELWGIDTDNWREVCLWETMQKMVFKSTNRVLVGLPLCQDEGYLRSSTAFASWLGAGAVVVGQYMPSALKPFFGYLTAIPIYIEKKKSFRYLVPVFKERMENMRRKRADPNFKFNEPKNLITWMSMAVIDNPTTTHSKPEALAQHLLFFALGAIHTTIITATNTFLDLLSSDPELKYYETLQEEASRIFREEGDWADPAALGKLPCADSTIRETLRKNPVLTRVTVREVVRKGGIDLPDGHHVPQGGWLAAPVVGIHHDERFYPDPEKYKPFRFAKAATETPANGETDGSQTEMAAQNRRLQGLPVASDSYLPWGYGRHSCPGRWLVAHQLKLLLAYVALNYDVQTLEKRPLNRIFGDSIVPSQTTTISVRRRKRDGNSETTS